MRLALLLLVAFGCSESVARCRSDADCPIGSSCSGTQGSFGVPLVSVCLRLCRLTSDCEAGESCIRAAQVPSWPGRLCASESKPPVDGRIPEGVHCDLHLGPRRCDGPNAIEATIGRLGGICGYVYKACPGTCSESTDGGWTTAICK